MPAQWSRRQLLSSLGIGAVGGGVFVGCTPSTSPQSAGSGSSGDGDGDAFGFFSWSLNEEAPKPVIEGFIERWQEQSGTTVDASAFPFADYLNQLTLQIRGGQFSGAAQLNVQWLATVAATGTLVDLGDSAGGPGYTEAALTSGQVDGQQLGLPWTIASIGMIGNSEILERAGVSEAPGSVDDFVDALREIKGVDPSIIPFAAMTKVDELKDIFTWMEVFGSPLLDDGRPVLDGSEAVDAVTWYKSLFDEGLMVPDVGRFDARALFSQGRTALYEDAIIAKGAVTAESPDPDLADKLVPWARPVVSSGDDPRSLLWGHVVGVVDGPGAQSAVEFVQWLTGEPDVALEYFEAVALPPTTTAALESSEVADDPYTAEWTEKITSTATPNPFWPYAAYSQIEKVVSEGVQAVLVGQSDPSSAMAEVNEEVSRLIA